MIKNILKEKTFLRIVNEENVEESLKEKVYNFSKILMRSRLKKNLS
jgi:hypothetical protein